MAETKPASAAAATPLLTRPVALPKSAVVPVPPSVLPAAAAAGLSAVVLLPLDRPGLGGFLTGLAVVAAVVYSYRRSRPPTRPGTSPV